MRRKLSRHNTNFKLNVGEANPTLLVEIPDFAKILSSTTDRSVKMIFAKRDRKFN